MVPDIQPITRVLVTAHNMDSWWFMDILGLEGFKGCHKKKCSFFEYFSLVYRGFTHRQKYDEFNSIQWVAKWSGEYWIRESVLITVMGGGRFYNLLVVEPTPLKNMLVKLDHFPTTRWGSEGGMKTGVVDAQMVTHDGTRANRYKWRKENL